MGGAFAAAAAAIFWAAAAWAASTALQLAGSSYSDLCSQTGVSCAYAYSIHQRLVAGNTKPATLTRLSDGATFNLSYSGPTFKVDPTPAVAFCLANGGTTTAETYTTQYNDCGVSAIYNQAVPVSSGARCDAVQAIQEDMPLFQVRLSDGEPELNESEDLAGAGAAHTQKPGAHWLRGSGPAPQSIHGCVLTAGAVPRTLIISSSNQYFQVEGGRMGQVQDLPASGPSGAMWSAIWWGPVTTSRTVPSGSYNFATDIEASASCPGVIPQKPVADAIGILTYSGPTNLQNTYYNGVQTATNCTPGKPIRTGYGITIGCEGDESHCGRYVFRDMVFLKTDVSATPGLAAAIYNYMKSL
jgi:hypothetical protein